MQLDEARELFHYRFEKWITQLQQEIWEGLSNEQKQAVEKYAWHHNQQSLRIYRQDDSLIRGDNIGSDSGIRTTAFTELAAFEAAILVPNSDFLHSVMKYADAIAIISSKVLSAKAG